MSASPLSAVNGRIATGAGAAAALIRARAVAWDCPLTDTPGRMTLHVWGCELRLIPDAPGARVEISGGERQMVLTLQDSATQLLGDEGIEVAWDSVAAGALAPGLSLMRVTRITQRSPGFTRVRLSGQDADRFWTGSLHFRLLLPPSGRQPVWPRISETGRTVWPDGDAALHRPVYTTVDHGPGWIDFDVFRHDLSPTCDWTRTVPTGAEVAIIGPGGGRCPDAAEIVLFGDETAVPAISRMLHLGCSISRAHVRAAVHDLGDLANNPLVRPTDDLLAAVGDVARPGGPYIWFAGPDDEARAVRTLLTQRGLKKTEFTSAAYWSRSKAA
ncbi:MAG: siderophore-interacting protein [Paracoccus denitrificans]|nr:MAG: siderophore-interacting protein [Paracoccus denitrificans]PZO85499.1 MAG: siderophore-interacting protein [Paracoccus denitrificans]